MDDDCKYIAVTTSCGKVVHLTREEAEASLTIRDLISSVGDGDVLNVPLPNVCLDTLNDVLAFVRSGALPDVGNERLGRLIHAANYLHMDGLLDVCCGVVAKRLEGKSVEEIREIFGLKSSWTASEEAAARAANAWAFE